MPPSIRWPPPLLVALMSILTSRTIALTGGHSPMVRRENKDTQGRTTKTSIGVNGYSSALTHNHNYADTNRDHFVALSIDAKATTQAQNLDMNVHLSAADRKRLGLHPDVVLPRRDTLLQTRAAIIRQRWFGNDSRAADSVPFSLLQDSAVTHKKHVLINTPPEHPNSDSLDQNSEAAADSAKRPLPKWIPNDAITEDGDVLIDRIIWLPEASRKMPGWTPPTMLEESSSKAYEAEMMRVGREDEIEEMLSIMESEAANGETIRDADTSESHDPFAFRYYKFTPIKLRKIQEADMVRIAEFHLWVQTYYIPLDQTSVAINEQGSNPLGEDAMKARDRNLHTAWADTHMGDIVLVFAKAYPLTSFAFSTSSHSPQDDPVQWYFEGSNDFRNWTMLHAQLFDGNVPESRRAVTDIFSWKIDCHVSDWREWGPCSENCSTGNRTRTRAIVRHSYNNGKCDNVFHQLGLCNEFDCEANITLKAGVIRGAKVDGITSVLVLALFAIAGAHMMEAA